MSCGIVENGHRVNVYATNPDGRSYQCDVNACTFTTSQGAKGSVSCKNIAVAGHAKNMVVCSSYSGVYTYKNAAGGSYGCR
jgi:hypothetical protein